MQMPAAAGAQIGRKRIGAFEPQITTETSAERIFLLRGIHGGEA